MSMRATSCPKVKIVCPEFRTGGQDPDADRQDDRAGDGQPDSSVRTQGGCAGAGLILKRLSAGGKSVRPQNGFRAKDKIMKRCKITILQRTLNEKLAREYAAPGFTKCPMMREGQVFYADYAKPEGFCDEAWKAVYQYVFALSHGAGKFYFGDWITKEGVAICSCNDGLRPVIMKIERTDQDSSIDYEPVE